MKANRSSQQLFKQKSQQSRNLNLSKQLRKHLSPLAEIFRIGPPLWNCSKSKKKKHIQRSSQYTSPNSYQSSEIVSKKQSRQKKTLKRKKVSQVISSNMLTKKNKQKISRSKDRGAQKQNMQKNVDSMIRQKYRIAKWKNKILKEFIVKTREETTDVNSLHYLGRQIQIFSSENSKRDQSKSFFGFLLSENQENCKKTTLVGSARILTLDWMFLISASLLLNRETVHLAIHYLDSYFSTRQQAQDKIPIFAVGALFLAVKQEQRELQSILLETACMSQKFNVIKQQVIESEKAILTHLNFRLKSNTLTFWIDYFALKWDKFVDSQEGCKAFLQANFNIKIKLRSSDGDCYRLYREMMELADVGLMFGDYVVFQKSRLALACIYLVVRIQSEKLHTRNQAEQDLFKTYYKLFQKRASPIFKDPLRINQIFNSFLTETCQFEITQIIPCIKYMANFLELQFNFNIDQKALDETKSYEDFIRRMTYSIQIKQYCLSKIC